MQVGALEDVKDALREVVQQPLLYPDLFARGALATPTKGVLLFGPPGGRLCTLVLLLPVKWHFGVAASHQVL